MKTNTQNLFKLPDYLVKVLVDRDNPIRLEQLRVKEFSEKIPVLEGERTVILPWSGGLDSTTSLLIALESGIKIITINFNYGQTYWKKEKETIKKLRSKIESDYKAVIHNWRSHEEINISWLDADLKKYFGGEWQHIFPMRNFIIIMETASYTNANKYAEVWFSCVQGEIPFSGGDKSIVFLTEVSKILNKRKIFLAVPLMGLNKTDIVNWSLCDKNRYHIIKDTISCFGSKDAGHCGKCLACFNRLVGFYSAGVMEDCGFAPRYELLRPIIEKYEKAFLGENYYSYTRKKSILSLIERLRKND